MMRAQVSPRGIVGRLEEGIWQEWDGACTMEHTIYRRKPLETQKRGAEENEMLFTSLPILLAFLGAIYKSSAHEMAKQ